MAPEPVQVPSVPTITTNGTPPERTNTLAPETTSSISPRRSLSPTALPPIQPPYLGKNIGTGGLLAAPRRSMSPNPQRKNSDAGLDDGTSENPAAILKSQASGMSKLIDAPTNSAPPAPGPKLPPIETGIASRLPSSVPSGPASAIDTLNSPRSATSGSVESGITATAGLGGDISPTTQRLGSISETLGPNYMGSVTPSTPFSPTMETRQSASYPDPRANSVSSASGSRGRHECPNCHQTFTRHHNLKSHLLTHSHEKPFQCLTCQSRFRRLHDLKRHQKLHTGERPHVCNSCGRRFARGDALARHTRGEGGCAGRRTSVGNLGDGGYNEGDINMDDVDGDDVMPDYPESPTARKAMSLPTSRSRQSYSRVRAQQSQKTQNLQPAPLPPRDISNHSYPPLNSGFAAPAPPSNKIFPPTINTSQSSSQVPSILQQGNLTDSPRALSPSNPGFGIPPQDSTSLGPRARSPSYSSGPFHQQPGMENNRRPTAIGQPSQSGYSLPPPNQTSPRGPNAPLPLSRPGSFSSHLAPPDPTTAGQSIFNSGEQGIWAYIRDLEKRLRDLEDKNQTMESRIIALTTERQSVGPPAPPQTGATAGQDSG